MFDGYASLNTRLSSLRATLSLLLFFFHGARTNLKLRKVAKAQTSNYQGMHGYLLPSRRNLLAKGQTFKDSVYTDSLLMKNWFSREIFEHPETTLKLTDSQNFAKNVSLWDLRHTNDVKCFRVIKYITVSHNRTMLLVRDLQNSFFVELTQKCISDFEICSGLRVTMLCKHESLMIQSSPLIDDIVLQAHLDFQFHGDKTDGSRIEWRPMKSVLGTQSDGLSSTISIFERTDGKVPNKDLETLVFPVLVLSKMTIASIETAQCTNIATKIKLNNNGPDAMAYEDSMHSDKKHYPLVYKICSCK